MKTTLPTSLMARCRKCLLALLTCGGMLGHFLLVAGVGAPLALVSTPAMAACTASGSTNQTFTYTAANISQDAKLDFSSSWTCYTDDWLFPRKDNSAYICYESTFGGALNYGANTMPYSGGFSDGSNSQGNITSGRWYGVYNNPVSGSLSLSTTFTVTVPAGAAAAMPAGTYTASGIVFRVDQQGNNTGPNNCEGASGGGGGWDSGSVTYTANFKVVASCALVSTPTIDFGTLGPGPVPAGGITASGGVSVKCTSGTDYTVYLGDGNQRLSGGGLRQMANGTSRLAYQLYKNSAHTQIWDATGGTTNKGGAGGWNDTGTGANRTLTVYGLIPAGTTVPGVIGTYTDTVVVTVTY